MPDRQIAGRLGDEHLTDLSISTAPVEDLQQAGIDVEIDAIHPVVSQKGNEENSAYFVAKVELDVDGEQRTEFLCHCWDFVARRFPGLEDLRAGDLAELGNCKHLERVKRNQGEDGLRAAENQALDEFGDETSVDE